MWHKEGSTFWTNLQRHCCCEQGALRTRETIEKFKRVPPQPGQTSPLLVYFGTLLTKGKLNAFESVELSQLVISQNKKHLLDNWLKVGNTAKQHVSKPVTLLWHLSSVMTYAKLPLQRVDVLALSWQLCILQFTASVAVSGLHSRTCHVWPLYQFDLHLGSRVFCVVGSNSLALLCQQEEKLEPSEQLGDLLRQAGDTDAALKCYRASGATTKVIEGRLASSALRCCKKLSMSPVAQA